MKGSFSLLIFSILWISLNISDLSAKIIEVSYTPKFSSGNVSTFFSITRLPPHLDQGVLITKNDEVARLMANTASLLPYYISVTLFSPSALGIVSINGKVFGGMIRIGPFYATGAFFADDFE